MRFHDLEGLPLDNVGVRHAFIAGFADIKQADAVANKLREIAKGEPGHEIFVFAAGLYYVVIMTPDFVEDTDVPNTNS